jgi:ABC-type uncharacterized transport system ATPase subunit
VWDIPAIDSYELNRAICRSPTPDYRRTLDETTDLRSHGDVVTCEDGYVTLRVPKSETARVTERLLTDLPIIDLTDEDPPIEEVIEQVSAQERE